MAHQNRLTTNGHRAVRQRVARLVPPFVDEKIAGHAPTGCDLARCPILYPERSAYLLFDAQGVSVMLWTLNAMSGYVSLAVKIFSHIEDVKSYECILISQSNHRASMIRSTGQTEIFPDDHGQFFLHSVTYGKYSLRLKTLSDEVLVPCFDVRPTVG